MGKIKLNDIPVKSLKRVESLSRGTLRIVPQELILEWAHAGVISSFPNLKELNVWIEPCVYFLLLDNEVVYVGQSTSLPGRATQHRDDKEFNRVLYMSVPKDRLDEIERKFIKELKPK